MMYSAIETAKTNRAKCNLCEEPIVKGEGVMRWNGGAKGITCHKCSLKHCNKWIQRYKAKIDLLNKKNHIGEKRMNELKIARMV